MPELKHDTIGTVGSAPDERAVDPLRQALSGVVEQPPEQASQMLEQAQRAQEQAAGMPKPQPQMADLRSLIELGKVRDTVTIGGMTFAMETLTDDEQQAVFKRAGDQTGADSFMELRRIVVAMSVTAVNNQPLESLVAGDQSPLDKRMAVVSNMQGHVVEKLYEFHDVLLGRAQQEIDPEQVKN